MDKTISVRGAVVLMAAAAFCAAVLTLLGQRLLEPSRMREMGDKLDALNATVSASYLNDVDTTKAVDAAAAGFINSLGDRYSAYLNKADYSAQQQSVKGNSAGIGVTVVQDPDSGNIRVVSAVSGAPADKAGIRPGDIIVSVGGKAVASLGYDAAVRAMQGTAGAAVSFTLERDGKSIDEKITRAGYQAQMVEYRAIGDLGYIKLSGFNDATAPQFGAALKALQDGGVKGLIFDLRDNGGGTLASVSSILDTLLPEGDIVSETVKGGKTTVLYRSGPSQVELPMDVLVNGNTASAAELFSAAIRDYKKGKLIGQKTFGKGIMQDTFPLGDGTAVRLTVAKYNPPSGKNYNGVGLTPDIPASFTAEQQKYFFNLTDTTDPFIAAAVKDLDK